MWRTNKSSPLPLPLPLWRCCYFGLALSLAAASSARAQGLGKRQLSPELGLSANNLDKNGIAMGFLPAWGERMSPNNATSLNALLPKPMAVMGAYSQIDSNDPNMTQLDPYLDDLRRQPGDLPVFALALMPSEGLANVTQEVAERVAQRMGQLNAEGISVWLRYAHEMNGEWYAWGQQPEAFIASWNLMTQAIRTYAPQTYMLWAPNMLFNNQNDTAAVQGGYEPYWPGKENVDIVGLSFYHYGGWERLNNWPDPGEAREVMHRFDQLFGSVQDIPLVLAETGAAWTRDAETGVNAPGNATESEIKWNWLWQLTNPDISRALPSYKALCWFEVVKDENAAGGTIVKEEDFRLITGSAEVAIGSVNFLAQTNLVHNRTAPETSVGATASPSPTAAGQSSSSGKSLVIGPAALLLLAATLVAYAI